MRKLTWYFIGVYILILVFTSENDLNKVIIQRWKLLLDIGHFRSKRPEFLTNIAICLDMMSEHLIDLALVLEAC